MVELNIVLPPIPSVNHLYFNCHGRRAMTSQGKKFKAGIGTLAAFEKDRQDWVYTVGEKVVMELRFFWPDRRRRDCDNSLKIIQDAFSGILYDDDRWILPRVMNWDIDKERPRVEVKFWKLSQSGK